MATSITCLRFFYCRRNYDHYYNDYYFYYYYDNHEHYYDYYYNNNTCSPWLDPRPQDQALLCCLR